jgi:hypothetical protein
LTQSAAARGIPSVSATAAGFDHVDRASAHVHHDGVRPGTGGGQSPEAGSAGFGEQAAGRPAEQARQEPGVVGAGRCPLE